MPLSNLLKSTAGTCPFCRQKAGILSREHADCRRTFQAGWNETVRLAADAAASHKFDEKSLRLSLAKIARRSYRDGSTVNQVLEEGWKHGVAHAMHGWVVTQAEEARDWLTQHSAAAEARSRILWNSKRRTAPQISRFSDGTGPRPLSCQSYTRLVIIR